MNIALPDILLRQFIEHFGLQTQRAKVQEELGELTAALARYENHLCCGDAVLAEAADVVTVLGQLIIILGPETFEDLLNKRLAAMRAHAAAWSGLPWRGVRGGS